MKTFTQFLLEWSRPRELMTPNQRRQKLRKERNNLENLKGRLASAESGGISALGRENIEKLKRVIASAEHGVFSGHWASPNEQKDIQAKKEATRNLLVDILGKKSYSDNREQIQADWDRRNPDRPRDPTGSFGERPRRDVYLNLLGFRNNIKGVIQRQTPLGQKLGAELKAMPDPNPRAGGQWPQVSGETPHFSDPNHPASFASRISELIRLHLGK